MAYLKQTVFELTEELKSSKRREEIVLKEMQELRATVSELCKEVSGLKTFGGMIDDHTEAKPKRATEPEHGHVPGPSNDGWHTRTGRRNKSRNDWTEAKDGGVDWTSQDDSAISNEARGKNIRVERIAHQTGPGDAVSRSSPGRKCSSRSTERQNTDNRKYTTPRSQDGGGGDFTGLVAPSSPGAAHQDGIRGGNRRRSPRRQIDQARKTLKLPISVLMMLKVRQGEALMCEARRQL